MRTTIKAMETMVKTDASRLPTTTPTLTRLDRDRVLSSGERERGRRIDRGREEKEREGGERDSKGKIRIA